MSDRVYFEDELLPLSALQHLVFCERQCALIHIEGLWRDNPLTLEGSRLHKRVDEDGPRRERRGNLVIARGLPLRSLILGLSGRADVVEFHRQSHPDPATESGSFASAVPLDGIGGHWAPFPVDYKRGKPKRDRCDEVQLCAQALCLQEMLGVQVPDGALFYGRTQRRQDVVFDEELRATTAEAACRLHELVSSGVTPRAMKMPKCKRCSLIDLCLPEAMGKGRSARTYLRQVTDDARREERTT